MKIKVSNSLLNILLAATTAGILFAEKFYLTSRVLIEIILLALLVGLILTWNRKELTVWIICPIIFFFLGAIRFLSVDNLSENDISKFSGQSVQVSGEIREEPQLKLLPNGSRQMRFVVDAKSIIINGNTKKICGGFILTFYPKEEEQIPEAQIGDKIFANGNLKLLTNYKNPGQIDNVIRLKANGITARLAAGKLGIEIIQTEGNLWTKFLRFVVNIRKHYKESMSSVMSAEDAAALFAMLFGGYAGLDPELVEEFQITGIIHILSVSGSHMSLLAMATAYLCLLLRCPRILTLLLGLFVIGTYSILSGLLPQVLRSATMGTLLFIAKALNVEAEVARFLTLTAFAMLLNQPLLLFDISFQLSFTSTAGLIYLAKNIQKHLKRFPNFFAVPTAMTLSAQIASLPIVIWYFNQVSLSSVLANVFVMPLLEIVIVGGLLSGIIAAVIPFIGRIFFVIEALIFSMGAELNKIFANLPLSSIQVPTLGTWAGLLYYIALISRRYVFLIAIVPIIIFNAVHFGNTLEVSFVDVGQGDCAVVITPHGRCLIFDTGGVREKMFDVGGRVVVPYLKHENIHEIDKIFLTHVHEDHSAGAGALIKKFPVKEIITAGESKSEYAAVFGISEKFLSNLRAGHTGEKFNIDGVEVEILFAPSVGSGNEISNLYHIRYGEITFLITGDLVKEIEAQILNENIDVSSTVLKVAHHGSATSSSEDFLRKVNPKCSVICVGYGNNFGHPREEVLERLEDISTKIYRTDRDGLVKFSTNGKNLKVKTFNKKNL